MTSYDESISYLEGLYHRPILPAAAVGLSRVERLLAELDHPERSFRSVHIAGSCGKGSTTTMIAGILRAGGRSTGLFLSPHLSRYTERISVDGVEVSPAEWGTLWEEIRPLVEAMQDGALPGYDLGRPSLFEVLFALACLYFRQRQVEWAAMETGLGGRLDATNTLQPEVAVLTNVSLEHTKVLGDTVEQIAAEKAAIIKLGAHAVLGTEDPRVLAVVDERVAVTESPVLRVGRDVQVEFGTVGLRGQDVRLVTKRGALDTHLATGAPYQATNAATAYLAALALRDRGVELGEAAVAGGLSTTRVPGRFEVVRDDPLILLDGAHNAEEVRAVATALRNLADKPVVLFAAMSDKNIAAMSAALAPMSRHVIVTRAPGTERAADPDDLAQCFRQSGATVLVEADADRALREALTMAASAPLLITGSLYLVGWARERLYEAATTC